VGHPVEHHQLALEEVHRRRDIVPGTPSNVVDLAGGILPKPYNKLSSSKRIFRSSAN
jgi:hypothetical protein